MSGPAKYFIVEADSMPEIFRKVAEAKRLLETGEESTVNGAARTVGISRSAFYKYKDAVRPFHDMLHGRIVTFQILLKDEPGILSGALNVLAGTRVNILTINQNIPVNGCCCGHHYRGDLRAPGLTGGCAEQPVGRRGGHPMRDTGRLTFGNKSNKVGLLWLM